MDKIKVLLVEDETTLAMIIKDTLEPQGFDISTARDGVEGLAAFSAHRPDVLVADVMMPRIDGFEMVRRIRRTDRLTPVLFLTARSAVDDVVAGFELGANDYLKKPFGMQELMVRIRALAGRAATYQAAPLTAGDTLLPVGRYRLDTVKQTLRLADHLMELSYRETEILRMLATHGNAVVETRDILLRLWGDDTFFNVRSLHVFITKLRHKLSHDEQVRIVNVRGVGYKLIVPEP
jgi:Response regulators consisting of a CheY-like receiver domain and a winged-helix DNA-binding domain